MHAQEQDGGHPSAGSGPGVGEGLEPLPAEPLCSGDQPPVDGGGGRQLGVAVEQERLDGFGAEDAAELGVQVAGCAVQAHPLGLHHFVGGHCGSPLRAGQLNVPVQAWAPIWTASQGLPSGGVYDRSRSLTAWTVMPWKMAAAMSMRLAISACLWPNSCMPSSRPV